MAEIGERRSMGAVPYKLKGTLARDPPIALTPRGERRLLALGLLRSVVSCPQGPRTTRADARDGCCYNRAFQL
jgi:hypothetical protein